MQNVSSPTVDVTIAVHSASRPIARAVSSVVDHTAAAVRVTVVAHNIDPAVIRGNLGAYAGHPDVRMLELQDGIPSPAGPMNLGMAEATAPFHALLGSDDEFAPGAVDSWLALQRSTGASVVIARIVLDSAGPDPYPPVRNGRRTRRLNAHRDRLFYRSAPLGLVSRERFGGLRLSEGLASGEDLAYSAALWITGDELAYDLHGPPYVGHDDAEDRVTFTPRPVADDFAFLDALEAEPWFRSASRSDRRALAVKLLRIHLFDAIAARARRTGFTGERVEILGVLARISRMAPGVLALLSLADHRVIEELRAPDLDVPRLERLLAARWAYRTPAAQLPRNPLLLLHPQAPTRTLLAGARSLSARPRPDDGGLPRTDRAH